MLHTKWKAKLKLQTLLYWNKVQEGLAIIRRSLLKLCGSQWEWNLSWLERLDMFVWPEHTWRFGMGNVNLLGICHWAVETLGLNLFPGHWRNWLPLWSPYFGCVGGKTELTHRREGEARSSAWKLDQKCERQFLWGLVLSSAWNSLPLPKGSSAEYEEPKLQDGCSFRMILQVILLFQVDLL